MCIAMVHNHIWYPENKKYQSEHMVHVSYIKLKIINIASLRIVWRSIVRTILVWSFVLLSSCG
jgi:hypothetical protein